MKLPWERPSRRLAMAKWRLDTAQTSQSHTLLRIAGGVAVVDGKFDTSSADVESIKGSLFESVDVKKRKREADLAYADKLARKRADASGHSCEKSSDEFKDERSLLDVMVIARQKKEVRLLRSLCSR